MGHTPTVDNANGTPELSAAFIAWHSPLRAYMPANPTGPSATGKL